MEKAFKELILALRSIGDALMGKTEPTNEIGQKRPNIMVRISWDDTYEDSSKAGKSILYKTYEEFLTDWLYQYNNNVQDKFSISVGYGQYVTFLYNTNKLEDLLGLPNSFPYQTYGVINTQILANLDPDAQELRLDEETGYYTLEYKEE